MEGIRFINLEYFFLLIYNFLTGVQYDALPTEISFAVGLLQDIGIGLSLVFFAALVYFHMRHERLHHEYEHKKEHEAEEEHEHGHKVENKRWDHVMQMMASAEPASWRGAIIEADIMLAELLYALALPGETIGDQLKAASRNHFTTLDLAWEAHRVRNAIAHAGSAYALSEQEARRAIDLYRQVFEEFTFI